MVIDLVWPHVPGHKFQLPGVIRIHGPAGLNTRKSNNPNLRVFANRNQTQALRWQQIVHYFKHWNSRIQKLQLNLRKSFLLKQLAVESPDRH
jgi:hypothetical protein